MKNSSSKTICLINPSSHFLINEKMMPPLGFLRIGAFLEKNGFNVLCLDLAGEECWQDKITEILFNKNIGVVGFTSTTPQIPLVYKMGKFIKDNFPSIKIILGGAHVTLSYGSIKSGSCRTEKSFRKIEKLFDHIVVGYGELAILKILNDKNAPKILDTEIDKDIYVTNEIYENLPCPARHLIDINSYQYNINGHKATSIISQLGCPFNCGFCCGNSKTYRKIRTRTPQSVLNEIDYLYKSYGYTGFMFYDDEINANSKSFELLLESLISYQKENSINFSFRGSSRADLFTEKQGNLMKDAGFEWLLFGFETGSDKILKSINKLTTVKQNTIAIETAKKCGLKVKALMSLGHPGESLETIQETMTWLGLVKPNDTNITIITLYPGSPYFDFSIKDGDRWKYTAKNGEILYSEDIDFLKTSSFYKSREDEYECFISTPFLSSREIVENRYKMEEFTKTLCGEA